jgi:hypothetical protein
VDLSAALCFALSARPHPARLFCALMHNMYSNNAAAPHPVLSLCAAGERASGRARITSPARALRCLRRGGSAKVDDAWNRWPYPFFSSCPGQQWAASARPQDAASACTVNHHRAVTLMLWCSHSPYSSPLRPLVPCAQPAHLHLPASASFSLPRYVHRSHFESLSCEHLGHYHNHVVKKNGRKLLGVEIHKVAR